MSPRGSPVWSELGCLGELVQEVLLVAAGAAALVVAVVSVHDRWRDRSPRRPRSSWRWWVHHRVVRRFAAAVAGAEFAEAEALAGVILSGHGPAARRRHQPARVSWDETVVTDGSELHAAQRLHSGVRFAAHCQGVRRLPGPGEDVLVVGRYRPLRLKLLSRRSLGTGGLRVSAEVGGVVLVGQLTVLPGPAASHVGGRSDRVEVWVHVAGPSGWRARRLLRRLRREIRRGLRRWADERTRRSPHDDRPRPSTRRWSSR